VALGGEAAELLALVLEGEEDLVGEVVRTTLQLAIAGGQSEVHVSRSLDGPRSILRE
jgi:hypothetical protein